MSENASPNLAALIARLQGLAPVAVAVSGGVDSMTLAFVAHRYGAGGAQMFHAVSPAVPPRATARVVRYGAREGWQLTLVNAGEFLDRRYMENPANRCFFCKQNLYGSLRGHTNATLVSGTNTDDLDDYRPGLGAADEFHVRHPYVEAGLDKAGVRAVARELGLSEVSELAAAPCLSSRVETGIAIDAEVLRAIHAVEEHVSDRLTASTVRCRLRREGIMVELDRDAYGALDTATCHAVETETSRIFRAVGLDRPVAFAPYRMGSAFLRAPGDG